MANFRALETVTSPRPNVRQLIVIEAANMAFEKGWESNREMAIHCILSVLVGLMSDEQARWFMDATPTKRECLVMDVSEAINFVREMNRKLPNGQ